MNLKDLNGRQKFEILRMEFPFFIYEGFDVSDVHEGIRVEYRFNAAGKHFFRPSFTIPHKHHHSSRLNAADLRTPAFDSLLFHIGLIEVISYWKAACPPKLIVKGMSLTEEQVAFWKKVYFNGLGEFFYTNGINTSMRDFMEISSEGDLARPLAYPLEDKVLVPVGGGKDSVVTLELLRHPFHVKPFILNPRGATLETTRVAGYSRNDIAELNRTLDPLLLKLNEEGYLNGHTPFSALLAFYTLLVSAMTGYRHIALSNESSANEPTVSGTEVNHQYSKSYAFEADFRRYVASFISPDFNYFSFLRPLHELQIARLFAGHVRYYGVFKSCNAGSKTDSWCCNCPKCLFAWIILSPFIPLDELVHIFGENLYEKPGMIRYLKELTGISEIKPFECVGTVDEVNAALRLFTGRHTNKRFPLLIDYWSNSSKYAASGQSDAEKLLAEINTEHFLQPGFYEILTRSLL